MPKLNASKRQELIGYLDQSPLGKDLFTLEFSASEPSLFEIRFNDVPAMTFRVFVDSGTWKTDECPGRTLTDQEIYSHANIDNAISAVHGWLQRVTAELMGPSIGPTPTADEARRYFEKLSTEFKEPDRPFTSNEATMWAARMSEIEKKLRALEEAGQLQRGYIEKLVSDLAELQKKATVLPKKTLIKAAGSKVASYLDHAILKSIEVTTEAGIKAAFAISAFKAIVGEAT